MSVPKRPSSIVKASDLMKPFDRGPQDMQSTGARFGPHFGFQQIGINYEVLPPGTRSSYPHAEKLEEEFIYVLSGTPDVWIDGELHPLVPGDAVGFRPGTGIAHSFLNNSDTDVHLLIVGEHQRAGNQLYYPLNPERMESFRQRGCAWDDAPKRKLGPHDGMPKAGTRSN
jgi:uncharacterized cupin superfamily protein